MLSVLFICNSYTLFLCLDCLLYRARTLSREAYSLYRWIYDPYVYVYLDTVIDHFTMCQIWHCCVHWSNMGNLRSVKWREEIKFIVCKEVLCVIWHIAKHLIHHNSWGFDHNLARGSLADNLWQLPHRHIAYARSLKHS